MMICDDFLGDLQWFAVIVITCESNNESWHTPRNHMWGGRINPLISENVIFIKIHNHLHMICNELQIYVTALFSKIKNDIFLGTSYRISVFI